MCLDDTYTLYDYKLCIHSVIPSILLISISVQSQIPFMHTIKLFLALQLEFDVHSSWNFAVNVYLLVKIIIVYNVHCTSIILHKINNFIIFI